MRFSNKLLVGVGRDPGLIIGWSVFRAPFRYMSDVRCEGVCTLLRILHHVIDELKVKERERWCVTEQE